MVIAVCGWLLCLRAPSAKMIKREAHEEQLPTSTDGALCVLCGCILSTFFGPTLLADKGGRVIGERGTGERQTIPL